MKYFKLDQKNIPKSPKMTNEAFRRRLLLRKFASSYRCSLWQALRRSNGQIYQ